MYKLSYYTIFSDYLNKEHLSVLFCTRSGEAILVNSKVRNLLEKGEFDALPTDTLNYLLKSKAIVEEEELELFSIIAENKQAIAEEKNTLYEVIQPTAYCQLGCDYCGQSHTKDYLSGELQEKLVARVSDKIQNGKYEKLLIGWFGGEPLVGLNQIRSLTKQFKHLCNSADIGYSAKVVTNGLSLKENIFLELVQEHNVHKIEITLDGIDVYHDQRRHTKSGEATFEIIFNNLISICNLPNFEELGCQISLRCNVDYRNYEGVSPLIQLLREKELHKKLAYFYPVGVYSWGGNDAHERSLTKEAFAGKEIDWLIEMIQAGFKPSILPGRVKEVCIAVSNDSDMYDAFGNIFNCTEVSYTSFYDNTPYVLGNLRLDSNTYSSDRPLSNWNDDILKGKFPCHTCKMLPVCGGACPKSWHEDMRACPSAKFNVKERLALAYILAHEGGIDHLTDLSVA